MSKPFEITFRHMKPSSAISKWAEEKASKLTTRHGHAMRCRLVVNSPEGQHRHGAQFRVHVEVGVKGADPFDLEASHEDVYAAIGHVFEITERRLTEHDRRRRELAQRAEPPDSAPQGGAE